MARDAVTSESSMIDDPTVRDFVPHNMTCCFEDYVENFSRQSKHNPQVISNNAIEASLVLASEGRLLMVVNRADAGTEKLRVHRMQFMRCVMYAQSLFLFLLPMEYVPALAIDVTVCRLPDGRFRALRWCPP